MFQQPLPVEETVVNQCRPLGLQGSVGFIWIPRPGAKKWESWSL